ncbi:MAG: UDP-glucose dehydrogenase family protein [Ilumatobacteraceae bacterium]
MSSRIAVIGTGYVGLTTGVCLAHLGHQVVCADIDAHKITLLSAGRLPIVEHGLAEMLTSGLASGRLSFVVGAARAAADCDMAFLCVPTPQGDDGSADLSYIKAAAREIAPVLPADAIVVNKSTVPVGSTKVVEAAMGRSDVRVVSNPEFLREGSAVRDFLHPDRVVVGSDDRDAAQRVAALYAPLGARTIVTDPASAETIKYAANAFLATKLSFINAVAAICEGVGADINDVVAGIGSDSRIGSTFLQPGPGWGGSCFPKDSRAMVKIADDAGYAFDLLSGVITVNEQQYDRTARKIASACGGSVAGKTIAVWGLTFKAGTDDLRESPSLHVITRLVAAGARVVAHDPTVPTHRVGVPTSVELAASPLAACAGADALSVLTEWDEYRSVAPSDVKAALRATAVVDARNLLDREAFVSAGFDYQGIGR